MSRLRIRGKCIIRLWTLNCASLKKKENISLMKQLMLIWTYQKNINVKYAAKQSISLKIAKDVMWRSFVHRVLKHCCYPAMIPNALNVIRMRVSAIYTKES